MYYILPWFLDYIFMTAHFFVVVLILQGLSSYMLVPVMMCGSRNVWDAAKTLLRETAPPLAKEPTEDGNLDVFGRCGFETVEL